MRDALQPPSVHATRPNLDAGTAALCGYAGVKEARESRKAFELQVIPRSALDLALPEAAVGSKVVRAIAARRWLYLTGKHSGSLTRARQPLTTPAPA